MSLDDLKSREELLAEVAELRHRVAQLEHAENRPLPLRRDDVLTATAVGVSASTGQEFYQLLALHLADSLSCEYAEVGITSPEKSNHIRTLALVSHGKLLDNIEYDLAHTPCSNVLKRELCLYPSRVQQEFPRDQWLTDWQVDSYAGTPLISASGEVLGLICVMSKRPFPDPSAVGAALQIFAVRAAAEIERERATQSLQNSEEMFRQIAENIRDVFWLFDYAQDRLLYVSPAFETVWGRPAAWLLEDHSRWLETIHEDDRTWIKVFDRRDLPGKTLEQYYRIRRPDGSIRWIHGRRFVVPNALGEDYRIAGVAEDITQQREAAERLQQQAAELAHVARVSSMGELVAGIAHEVNQPLHVISVFSSTISAALAGEGKWEPRDLAKWNDEIARAAGRAADIIRRLRGYVSKGPPTWSQVDLNSLIRESLELVVIERRQHRARVDLQLLEPAPILVADAIGIQQVLVNLLRNAIEAMSERETSERIVAVRTRVTAEGIEVSVIDRGTGISPEEMPRLFEPFFTSKATGMGMGLPISRTIIEAHGGRIWAENNEAGGATFSFVLPIRKDAAAATSQCKTG
ncbi:MAG: ATP-binding protein [Pirellulaceae bacterium]|jgi:two-component system sensor kinase FixL|nr:ATP-binding protein [Pirellulaceae bacterium]